VVGDLGLLESLEKGTYRTSAANSPLFSRGVGGFVWRFLILGLKKPWNRRLILYRSSDSAKP
jgi:hypothetical protein